MNVTEYSLSVAQSAIAAYFFCEIALHAQRGVFLAEPFQLGPLGLGQVLVGNPPGLPGFLHPFA
jgi:hypothetical protein